MAFSPSRTFDYNDEDDLTFAEISSYEEWVAFYSDLAMSDSISSMGTLARGWAVDGTIDPPLLTQHPVSSNVSAYNAPMQQL